MLRCVPGPVVLVVLCGEANTDPCCVCVPGGLCDWPYFVRACVLVVCQICACMRWAVLAPM